MTSGIFITGTGTDVGKTFVSALVVDFFRKTGLDAGYYKPILSGTTTDQGRLILGDAQYVTDYCRLPLPPEQVVTYHFPLAASPHLAAKTAGVVIDPEKIIAHYTRLQSHYDYLVVEGCGGIICPLGETLMLIDLIKALGLATIVVAQSGLGTLNVTLLTIHYLRAHKIPIKYLILNDYDEHNLIHQDNRMMLKKFTQLPIHTVKHAHH